MAAKPVMTRSVFCLPHMLKQHHLSMPMGDLTDTLWVAGMQLSSVSFVEFVPMAAKQGQRG